MFVFILTAVLLGLCFGSFANVVAYRLPKGESIVTPRSHCTQCQHVLSWWENIPLVSYVILRARCRNCKEHISLRYPAIELTYALWALLNALKFAPTMDIGGFATNFVIGGILITASAIDLEYYILPDVLTLPGALLAFLGAIFFLNVPWQQSLLGGLIGFGGFFAIQQGYRLIRHEEGLGGGDVKLMLLLGAWHGLESLLTITMVAAVLGLIVGLIAMRFQPDKGLKARIPFGPFLSFAGLFYALWGAQLWAWYLS